MPAPRLRRLSRWQQGQLTELRSKAVLVDKLHKGVEKGAAHALAKNDGRKFQISYEVAAPHSARLARKSIEPLAANLLCPQGGARNDSAHDLE